MDHTMSLPCVIESLRDRIKDDNGIGFGYLLLTRQYQRKGEPVNVIHYEVIAAIAAVRLIGVHDAGMVDALHHAAFLHELTDLLTGCRGLLEHHLYGDLLVQTAMEAKPHLTHSTYADEMLKADSGNFYWRSAHLRLAPVP